MNLQDAKHYSLDDINYFASQGRVSRDVLQAYAVLKTRHSIVGEYRVRDRLTANNCLAPEVYLYKQFY